LGFARIGVDQASGTGGTQEGSAGKDRHQGSGISYQKPNNITPLAPDH
jgi:hypothetical protein